MGVTRAAARFGAGDRDAILDSLYRARPDAETCDSVLRHVGLVVADYRQAERDGTHKAPSKAVTNRQIKALGAALDGLITRLLDLSSSARESLLIARMAAGMKEASGAVRDRDYSDFDAGLRTERGRFIRFAFEAGGFLDATKLALSILSSQKGAKGGEIPNEGRSVVGFALAVIWHQRTGRTPTLTQPGRQLTYPGFVEAVIAAGKLPLGAERTARDGLAAYKSYR